MTLTDGERKWLERECVEMGRSLEGIRARLLSLSSGDDGDQARRLMDMREALMRAVHVLVAYLWGVKGAELIPEETTK